MIVVDNRGNNIPKKTGLPTAHIMMPSLPVAIHLALAVFPGGDDVFILGSKRLPERLNIEKVDSRRGKALGRW